MPLSFLSLDFLFTSTRKATRGCLDKLPNDVLVDIVFDHLEVADILRLRRVSKLYYHLTHHAVIWKRLVLRTTLPLPPLPPTARHSLKNLSGLEAERLLTRAHSLDKIWRLNPDLFDQWMFDAYDHVAHMVLLPGSQYMVASVSDVDRQDWALVVYVLDSKYNVIPIAKTPTRTKAYNLQAKYLTINGVHGIGVSYVIRDWRHRKDRQYGINVSEYSPEHDIDPPYPLKYECNTYFITLKVLEDLCDPRFVPGSRAFLENAVAQPTPFKHMCLVRSSTPITNICLDDFYGNPCVSVVKHPDTIVFKPLCDDGPVSMVKMLPFAEFAEMPHRIKAIRPLPQQHQFLVFREITVPISRNKWPVITMELFNIPDNTTGHTQQYDVNPTNWLFMTDDRFADVQITDHGTPNWFDDSIAGDVRSGGETNAWQPRTISAFCRTTAPDDGLLRITFYPRRAQHTGLPPPLPAGGGARRAPTNYWRYDLAYCSPVRFIEAHLNAQYRILPGSHRTALYTVPWDDITATPRIIGFYRYHDRELLAAEPEDHDMQVNQAPRFPVQKLPFEFDCAMRFQAIAWDESIGRVCFARTHDTRVVVLDFSKRPKEDFLGRRMPLPADQDHDVYAEAEPELNTDNGSSDSQDSTDEGSDFGFQLPVVNPVAQNSTTKAGDGSRERGGESRIAVDLL